MASRTTTDPAANAAPAGTTDPAANAAAETTEAADAPKGKYTEETYTVQLPNVKEGSGDVTVGVNGKIYKIMRGEKVTVPRAVYEVLMNSEKMDNLAIVRQRAAQSK
jgi:hypothetical protein